MEQSDFSDFNITVVGLGLIGGSYAMALKSLNPKNLWGIDTDENTLKIAEQRGIITKGYSNGEEPLKDSDLAILAVYPKLVPSFIRENALNFKPGCIITDVSGIKGPIIEEISSCLPEGVDFIGGHPMAGNEHQGLAFASLDLFHGCNYILTPDENISEEKINILTSVLEGIGCKTIVKVTPQRHDEIIAYTSQLPHVLAAALMNCCRVDEDLKSFIGGSFRDATRVAHINSSLWVELFDQNKGNIIKEIEMFEEAIRHIKNSLAMDDREGVKMFLDKAKSKREEMEDIGHSHG